MNPETRQTPSSRLYAFLFRKKAPYWLRRHSLLKLFWKMVRKTLNVSVIPFIPFNGLRIGLYRLVGYRIGKGCFIGMMCYLDDCHPELMELQDHVTVSYRVTFATHGPSRRGWRNEPVRLEEGCYIGVGAIILSGVVVGKGAMVGAGAVVTKDVAPETTVVGIPARDIEKRAGKTANRRRGHQRVPVRK
jgi:acetyltransferase-like isoleucine patch superfamily enzyme